VDENTPCLRIRAPLGGIEPHRLMLKVPADDQLLYKMMTIENLLRSIRCDYLHFNRVDCYSDFPGADTHDGQQLPRDEQGSVTAKFANAPDFSAANYYDRSRARTYSCCFSLDNSSFIWKRYANGSEKGKACVVFRFGNLRTTLNRIFQSKSATLMYNRLRCHQIFSVNYRIVEYVEWDRHRANTERLLNPIKYTYLKDESFAQEKELRISLTAPGIGQFVLNDETMMNFPTSLQVGFDFRTAIADGTIQKLLCAPDSDSAFLHAELCKLRIVPSEESDPPRRKGSPLDSGASECRTA
jgi:hypothetical protein